MRNLVFLSLLIVFGCTEKREPEIFNFPKNYRGIVLIVFNQRDGVQEQYYISNTPERTKFRVYNIPANGILRTRFKPNLGELPVSLERFFYDFYSDSSREELKMRGLDFVDPGFDVISVWTDQTGNFNENSKQIEYQSLQVGTRYDFIDSNTKKELGKWHGYEDSVLSKLLSMQK